MARPLRIEFPGAVYHVTSRGNRRELIFVDDADRVRLLAIVGQCMERLDARVLAYCLMGNHYHFVLHTRRANLSQLMRRLNGVYTQSFNRRHAKVGHVFQGRFKAILVDRDEYLLELCRYVELNPVRAKLVSAAAEWPWSSYRAHAQIEPGPVWLDTESVHACLLGCPPRGEADRAHAGARYSELVAAARDVRLWNGALRQQIYLGDEDFVARMQAQAAANLTTVVEIPKVQRSDPEGLEHWLRICESREEALWRAHIQSGITMSVLARALGLSVSRVSRLIGMFAREARGKT